MSVSCFLQTHIKGMHSIGIDFVLSHKQRQKGFLENLHASLLASKGGGWSVASFGSFVMHIFVSAAGSLF